MRIAVAANIQGNRIALEAFLADARNFAIDQIWAAGNVIGEGPDSDACLDIVLEKAAGMIAGDYEHRVVAGNYKSNDSGRAAFLAWLKQKFEEDGNIPDFPDQALVQADDVVHIAYRKFAGSKIPLIQPTAEGQSHAFNMLAEIGARDVIAIGHPSAPCVYTIERYRTVPARSAEEGYGLRYYLSIPEPHLFNVGSVGAGNNGRAEYMIFDSERRAATFRFVPYDADRNLRQIVRMTAPKNIKSWLMERNR